MVAATKRASRPLHNDVGQERQEPQAMLPDQGAHHKSDFTMYCVANVRAFLHDAQLAGLRWVDGIKGPPFRVVSPITRSCCELRGGSRALSYRKPYE